MLAALGSAVAFGQVSPANPAQIATTAIPGQAQSGCDVELSGDRLIVGAWGEPLSTFVGAAYIHERQLDGSWLQVARMSVVAGVSNDSFGRSVAIDGDLAIAGVPGRGGATGAVSVWRRGSGGTWFEDQVLVHSDAVPVDQLGLRVALDGETLLAGAPVKDFATGAASVFVRGVGGTWSQQAKLTASNAAVGDLFGIDVALQGDHALIGACSTGANEGSAYLFRRTGTTWSQVQEVRRNPVTANDLFGISVALSESGEAAIGASQRGSGNPAAFGFVSVYRRHGDVLGFEQEIAPPMLIAELGSGFGLRVELAGGLLVASQGSFNNDRGRALLYERGASGWFRSATIQGALPQIGDQFGGGVDIPVGANVVLLNGGLALDGHALAVGARGDDGLNGDDRGVVHFFDLDEVHPSVCGSLPMAPNGCSTCPCGNAAVAATYLGGCSNPDGRSAAIVASGRPSLSTNALRLELRGGTSTSFGVLVSGLNLLPAASPQCAPGSGLTSGVLDGLRCVGGAVQRHGSRALDANGDAGVTSPAWGPPNGPAGGLLLQAGSVVGQTRYFQVFYRVNPALGCGTGQNTSDAVAIRALP